jgi:hypothetical protein
MQLLSFYLVLVHNLAFTGDLQLAVRSEAVQTARVGQSDMAEAARLGLLL